MNIFYIHWNEDEWKQRVKNFLTDGNVVTGSWKSGAHDDLMIQLPDILVISLDRLPSHGSTLAQWFWESKKRQHIPIIFEGGAEEKLIKIKSLFPKATFVSKGEVLQELRKLQLRQTIP